KQKTYIKRTEPNTETKDVAPVISTPEVESNAAKPAVVATPENVAAVVAPKTTAPVVDKVDFDLSPETIKAQELEDARQMQLAKDQRLEDSINRNADKVRQQAAAKLQAAARAQQPAGARTSHTGAKPAQTGARPPHTGAKPAQAGARPPHTGAKPAQAGARSSQTGAKLAQVGVAPPPAPAKTQEENRTRRPAKPAGGGSSYAGKDAKRNSGGGSNSNNTNKKKGGKQPSARVIQQNDGKHQFEMPVAQMTYDVTIPEMIIVSELANKMNVKAAMVIKHLMKLGIMATINQSIDQDTAAILVEDMGHKAIIQSDDDFEKEMLAEVTEDEQYPELPRAPIVTIMGHVDHGKTSLLDYIRKTRVAAGEAGGITQHIGAYQVKTDHGSVTFLDTPGHAAFTAMRARGADVTDVVIIVVAADDGVMPQTKEAVEHARAANVPIIIAMNKMDKPGVNPDKVMQELSVLNVLAEEWGGDVQFLKISAKTGQGVDELIESLIVQTEILELTAPIQGAASGIVIESRLDRGRGVVATVLVQRGTLESGQMVLCGHEYGRVRAMFNELGKTIKTAGPCEPVEILGLSSTPNAGDEFLVVQNERVAKELAKHREDRKRFSRHAAQQASKLDEVFAKMTAGEVSTLNLVLKTDVQGSLEALRSSLIELSNDEVEVKVVYGGVGGINEGDVNLALASGAILMGFNVRADATSRRMIEERGVDLHYYSIIYEAIDEVKKSISGMLAPEIKEQFVGLAEVRDVFKSPKIGAIAGCMVLDGTVKRNLPIRVLRENVVIYEGQLESLRRYKDDIAEVKMGMECGIGVKNYNDVRAGDQIEVFERIEVRREL
ncbi:MAG: translation initiation factor IF-2, partial [Methylococcales bacterium]|nr:translation initiation factor IF-2 [Methylococcales bacterium]